MNMIMDETVGIIVIQGALPGMIRDQGYCTGQVGGCSRAWQFLERMNVC